MMERTIEKRLLEFFLDVAHGAHPGIEIDSGARGAIEWNVKNDKIRMEFVSSMHDSGMILSEAAAGFRNLPQTRRSLAKQLSALGITWVSARYEGCGDSGDVTEVKNALEDVMLDAMLDMRLSGFSWDVACTEHPDLENNSILDSELAWRLTEGHSVHRSERLAPKPFLRGQMTAPGRLDGTRRAVQKNVSRPDFAFS